ncbi:hypothetical protein [Rhizobium sp. C1]|uniref:hypothetical protein n=1 Tax=Rhizobium sp. C1 TaxID=1349799 RepID=UPI001E354BFC|nr:hypothetical protein [Rhizobium sp. C1]MCD2176928.1 hypothetical protein [Rhizobium sp. C1]
MKKFLAIGGAVLALFGVSKYSDYRSTQRDLDRCYQAARQRRPPASRLTEQDFRFQLPNGRDCGDAASYLASHQNGSSYSSGSGGGYFGGHGLGGGAHFGGFGHAGSGVHGGS